jgi:asparaginyl-tRNA synthetase
MEATVQAKKDMFAALQKFDAHLLDHMYLVFDKISVADVAAATTCINLYKLILTEKDREGLKNLTRWFYTCVNQPQFKDIVGVVSENAVSSTGSSETKTSSVVASVNSNTGPVSNSPAVVNVEYNTTLENGGLWRRNRTRLREIICRPDKGLGLVGQTIEVAGWVKSLQKNMRFLQLGDGSCASTLQIVMDDEFLKEGKEDIKNCGGTDACVRVFGMLVEGKRKENPVEVQAIKITVHGKNLDNARYPIAKGRQGIQFDTLRQHMHLRIRTTIMSCVMRLRNSCAFATHRFFQQRGFNYVHTPIITASDCEGAGEMFQVTTMLEKQENWDKLRKNPKLEGRQYKQDFFKKPAFMTVSGQLNVETYACALCDVYTFGPTFRAENSNTSRHLAEFWMIEPEIAFGDLDDNAKLAEDYLKYCIQYCFDNNMDDIQFLNDKALKREAAKLKAKDERGRQAMSGMTAQLENLKRVVAGPFQRMTYTAAIEKLQKDVADGKVTFDPEEEKKDPLRWGLDLRSEHERYLAEKVYRCPVIVTDYPKDFKAFYMRMNEDGKTVRAMDILAPGIGELMGGSQREERLDVLEERIRGQDQDPEMYSWYCDLRRYGTVPHSGFGLGFERLVQYVSGMENIRDVIPFPRFPGSAEF